MAALFASLGVIGVATSPAVATNNNDGGEEICYEQVAEAQYRKFTAPTDAGPWVLFGTWWQDQVDKWWPDTGEVVEGPGNHPDGRYTYRRVAQRVVDGDQIPCPQPNPEPPLPSIQVTLTCEGTLDWQYGVNWGDYEGGDLTITLLEDGSVVEQQVVAFGDATQTFKSGSFSGLDPSATYIVEFELVYEFTIPLAIVNQVELTPQENCEPPPTTVPPTTVPPTTVPPTTVPPTGELSLTAVAPVCVADTPFIAVTFGNQLSSTVVRRR